MNTKKYIQVSKIDEASFPYPIKPNIFYKWKHQKKYPEIFRKIGGFLFVDLEALEKLFNSQDENP